jgi:hypothetical protein
MKQLSILFFFALLAICIAECVFPITYYPPMEYQKCETDVDCPDKQTCCKTLFTVSYCRGEGGKKMETVEAIETVSVGRRN